MVAYTPHSCSGTTIILLSVKGVLTRRVLGRLLVMLKQDEGLAAARQCRDHVIWMGSYPIKGYNG